MNNEQTKKGGKGKMGKHAKSPAYTGDAHDHAEGSGNSRIAGKGGGKGRSGHLRKGKEY